MLLMFLEGRRDPASIMTSVWIVGYRWFIDCHLGCQLGFSNFGWAVHCMMGNDTSPLADCKRRLYAYMQDEECLKWQGVNTTRFTL